MIDFGLHKTCANLSREYVYAYQLVCVCVCVNPDSKVILTQIIMSVKRMHPLCMGPKNITELPYIQISDIIINMIKSSLNTLLHFSAQKIEQFRFRLHYCMTVFHGVPHLSERILR